MIKSYNLIEDTLQTTGDKTKQHIKTGIDKMKHSLMNDNQKQHYHELEEECRKAKKPKQLVQALNSHWWHLYMVADPYQFAKLSPAFSKKHTKNLLSYNKNVPGDQRAFVMKDLSVITPTSHMATTWQISKIKRDEVYWHNIGVYAKTQSNTEDLFKRGKEVASVLDKNPTSLVCLENHLYLSFHAALSLFDNHPDGGIRACYDMDDALERSLENIPGISIEFRNGYDHAIISYEGPHNNAAWEMVADLEQEEISSYITLNFQRIDNRG